jgi:MFS family permease
MALIGLGNSLVDINAFTIVQRVVPDAVMGRVFGAMESAIIGAMAIGALTMPLLIATVGLRYRSIQRRAFTGKRFGRDPHNRQACPARIMVSPSGAPLAMHKTPHNGVQPCNLIYFSFGPLFSED